MTILKTIVFDPEVKCLREADVHYEAIIMSEEHDGLIEFVRVESNGVEVFPTNGEYNRLASIILFEMSKDGCTI
jgi:hypothetical protein